MNAYHQFQPGELVIPGLDQPVYRLNYEGIGMVIDSVPDDPGPYARDRGERVYVLWPAGETCMSDWEIEPLKEHE